MAIVCALCHEMDMKTWVKEREKKARSDLLKKMKLKKKESEENRTTTEKIKRTRVHGILRHRRHAWLAAMHNEPCWCLCRRCSDDVLGVASLFASWWPWQRSQQATAGTRRDKNWRLTSLNPTMSSPKLLAGREGHCREVEYVRYVPASSVGKERVCFPLSPLFVAWKKTRHSCTCP